MNWLPCCHDGVSENLLEGLWLYKLFAWSRLASRRLAASERNARLWCGRAFPLYDVLEVSVVELLVFVIQSSALIDGRVASKQPGFVVARAVPPYKPICV